MNKSTYEAHFSNLCESELKLLCFLAYHGEDFSISSGTEYRKFIKIKKASYDEAINKLNDLGYISGKTFVKPKWHITALKELYTNHSEWIEKFKNIKVFTRSKTAEYLCRIVKYLIAGDYTAAAKVKRPYIDLGYKQFNLLNYLQLATKENLRLMKMLNDHEMRDMMSEMLKYLFTEDELSEDTIEALRQMINSENKFKDEMNGEIDAYEFLQYGYHTINTTEQTTWSEAIKATKLLYENKVEESVEVFESALKSYRKTSTAFANPIFNYIYGIALYRESKIKSRHATTKLKTFAHNLDIRYTDENFCINLLLASIDGDRDETNRAEYIINRHKEKMYNSFAFILFNLFEKPTEKITSNNLHSSVFFRHEMSPYLPIGAEAKDRYRELFGGAPLISTLKKRASWEMAFQEIENRLAKQENKEKRIAYYLDKYDLKAIIEQTKEDNEWKDGQVLSLPALRKGDYEIMNPTDEMIANSIPENDGYTNAANVIVPLLSETDRLYFGSYYDETKAQIRVTHEKPILSFKGKGAAIEIDSNVGIDKNGHIRKHTLVCEKDGEYTLITTNPFQRDVIQKFLSIKGLPSTAVISLKKAIESLNGIIDVVDGELEALMQPSIYSKGILAIRITPREHEYNVSVLASAMENGNARFAPAEGEQLVYDEVENITHCINRDLKLEHENYILVKNFLEQELHCEFDTYTETNICMDESLLKFIAYIYDNQDKFFIEWPEGKPLRFKGDIKPSDIQINIKSDVEWFCLDGNVKTKRLSLSLSAFIRACCSSTSINGFVKISDDEYVRMSEELIRHIAALDAFPSHKRQVKTIPKFQIGALASMIKGLKVNEDGSYTRFMEKTREAYSITPSVPKGLKVKLRDYQEEGFRWMCRLSEWGAGACLADDMGLGKTVQAIAFLLHKSADGPSLVVAPKSVLPNWMHEIARFAPELKCVNINNEKNKAKYIEAAGANDIILCTYGLLGTQGGNLSNKEWNVVCLDEAHQIKNRNTHASRISMELKSKSKVILTGTPLQNNLGELWNLFQFINPGLLGTWNMFKDSFITPSLDDEHKAILKEMTTPFILRRTKQDVLTELPEKIIQEYLVELTENERTVYEEMRRRAEIKFKSHKTKAERAEAKQLHINFFTELMHLREAACSLRLVYNEWTKRSSKIDALLEILDRVMTCPDNNVVVFSQFTSFLELIKPELKRRNLAFLYLDGQTPIHKREKSIEDFQEGRCRLFLSSLKAGGVGINLTRANYVIILDPWWNPAIESQAMDRAHRLGQKRVVTVIKLISAQTIEEKILKFHEQKQLLTEDILEGTSESGKLTYEDIMDMVSPF
ncbi:MAG: DEAD/DEAH box helicase [Bacteroidales bacterium]|nr:DEAD/DEAH box helicase [Candidatus Physcocola equi]